jgi:uncharacterized protein YdeI (YjbR/CyaY-like superfamily)
MNKVKLASGLVHKIPDDLAKALLKNDEIFNLWNSLTVIARNEFLCWVENAKQDKTRQRRIKRTIEELLEGQKRPCCWAGCIHRTDKAPSSSQRFVYKLDK